MNRILALFRTCGGPRIPLPHDFYKDLDWFVCFFPHFNGVACLKKDPIDDSQELYLDACLKGMGVVWQTRFYATPIYEVPRAHKNPPRNAQFCDNIESMGLLFAITIHCDKMSVVQVVGSGKTRTNS